MSIRLTHFNHSISGWQCLKPADITVPIWANLTYYLFHIFSQLLVFPFSVASPLETIFKMLNYSFLSIF